MLDAFGSEQLIEISKARRLFPGPPALVTVRKWYSDGLEDPLDTTNRIKLDTVKVGKFVYTSIEAMRRFLVAQNRSEDELVVFHDDQ